MTRRVMMGNVILLLKDYKRSTFLSLKLSKKYWYIFMIHFSFLLLRNLITSKNIYKVVDLSNNTKK